MKSAMLTLVIVMAISGCAPLQHMKEGYESYKSQMGEIRSGHRCYGDSRDDATWQCAGYQTPAQIAQKAEQAKVAEENARIAAKNQAIADAKKAADAADPVFQAKAAKLRAEQDKRMAEYEAKIDADIARQAAIDAKAQAKQDAIDAKREQQALAEFMKPFKDAAKKAKAAEQVRRAKLTPFEREMEDQTEKMENAQVKSAMRLREKMRAAEACYRFAGRVC